MLKCDWVRAGGALRSVLAVGLLFFASSTEGAEGEVLLDHVSNGATPAVVIDVVRQAFLGRHWKIESVDANSVTATIHRELLTVRMRIYLAERRLLYEGTTTRRVVGNPAQGQISTSARSFPSNWANNLRNDIGIALAVIPDKTP